MRGIATINPPPSNSPYSFILGLMSVFACFGTGNRRFQMVCTACRRAFVLRRAIPVANRCYRHRQHLPLIRMHHHRTQLLMGVRARTVAMPGPQTARTVNPLGGKGAGTIHGYQIMTTPRRHPLQHFAALGALQYLLKPPPIPHQRNRIQATAQGRVAGNLRQTDRTDNADSSPPPSAGASLHQTAAARRASPENTARPDIRQSPVENFRPHTSSTTASNTSRTTRSTPGLLTSLRNFNVPILGYLVCLVTLY